MQCADHHLVETSGLAPPRKARLMAGRSSIERLPRPIQALVQRGDRRGRHHRRDRPAHPRAWRHLLAFGRRPLRQEGPRKAAALERGQGARRFLAQVAGRAARGRNRAARARDAPVSRTARRHRPRPRRGTAHCRPDRPARARHAPHRRRRQERCGARERRRPHGRRAKQDAKGRRGAVARGCRHHPAPKSRASGTDGPRRRTTKARTGSISTAIRCAAPVRHEPPWAARVGPLWATLGRNGPE